jgi:ribosomal protein L37AE/L43A
VNSAWADAVSQAKRVNVVDLAMQRVELKRAAGQEWQGPCPKCGGTDRLHVKADGWFCRQCKPIDAGGHGWHDPISWIQHTSNVTFDDAVSILTGVKRDATSAPRQTPAQPARAQPAQPSTPAPQTDEWRAKAQPILDAAIMALLVGDNAGAAYLSGRGLDSATWAEFGLGFGAFHDRPAIVIPWYRGGKLQAIRYRFIEPADGPKIVSEPGSKFAGAMYGGQTLCGGPEHLRTLVICEGEINAMSIWQAARDSYVDVLSTGSESAIIPKAALEYAATFRTCVVWMDKPDIAQKWAAQIAGAVAVASPGGMDANDLLRSGRLAYFLTVSRLKACCTDAQRAALRWDLWDQHNLYGGLDDRTVGLAEGIPCHS